MTPRKFQREKQKSAFARVRANWKAYAKKARREGTPVPTFEEWLGLS